MAETAKPPDPTSVDGGWDEWDVPLRRPPMPELHLEGFDGPMDLLLALAERQRIDFGRMSVQALAEQFVAAMDALAERPEGGELTEFVPAIPAEAAQRPLKARAAVASTFVAGLELAGIGVAEVTQQASFGTAQIRMSQTYLKAEM